MIGCARCRFRFDPARLYAPSSVRNPLPPPITPLAMLPITATAIFIAIATNVPPPPALISYPIFAITSYDDPTIMQFVAAVNKQEKIFQYGDEFQALNVMYMKDGGSRAWHYDGSEYVITLMLQAPEAGGEFEYAPFIRGEKFGEENFPDVKKVFEGKWKTKQSCPSPGSLSVFNGRRSLHRVRAVYGEKDRVMSVLSYAKTEGEYSSPEKNVSLYGDRVKRIFEARGITFQ